MEYIGTDIDGTIYNGESAVDFVFFTLKKYKKIALPRYSLPSGITLGLYAVTPKSIINSTISAWTFIKEVDNIEKHTAEFMEMYQNKINFDFINKVLLKTGKPLLGLTGTANFIMKEMVKYIPEMKNFIATNIYSNGILKGELQSKYCYGEEKKDRFYKEYLSGSMLEYYTNNKSDGRGLKGLAQEIYLVKKGKVIDSIS